MTHLIVLCSNKFNFQVYEGQLLRLILTSLQPQGAAVHNFVIQLALSMVHRVTIFIFIIFLIFLNKIFKERASLYSNGCLIVCCYSYRLLQKALKFTML